MKLATSAPIPVHRTLDLVPSLSLTAFGWTNFLRKKQFYQYYSHPSHHLHLQNPFLDHIVSDGKILWSCQIQQPYRSKTAAALPTQVQAVASPPWTL